MMTEISVFQILFYLIIVLAFVKPLGWYMAQVYQGKPCGLHRILNPVEHFIYRLSSISSKEEMNWKSYLSAMFLFNVLGFLLIYILQRLQFFLPLNPQLFSGIPPELAFNTAVSFITNTDWQAYAGESTVSYFTQMLAFTTQNFFSAATGMSLLMALIRGFIGCETNNLGNFWVDMVRSILYILLPLSLIFAMILIPQGVIQNYKPYLKTNVLQAMSYEKTNKNSHDKSIIEIKKIANQIIPMGPVASQVAIKQLGSNGGGFFNTNSAHPYENPTPLSNFLEMIAILLIPAALCYTFGIMVNDRRQGWSILFAMMLIFAFCLCVSVVVEQKGNPAFAKMGIDQTPQNSIYPGGNMEGKETRFGIISSIIWTMATTATSNGSINAMHDSLMPMTSLMSLWLMHLSEVVFGGVGSGLYGMLMFIIIAVFVAGLMVGRTPEYLGKKIEPYEIKMVSVAILVMPLIVLSFTAIAVATTIGKNAITNSGAHGLTEILYAFTSMANNNGSAFAGLNANNFFYNGLGAIAMLVGRYWTVIPILAIAGSLARKKMIPRTAGTLSTHTPLFTALLISVILVLGALSFFPILSLGPIVEQLILQ